MCVMLDGRFRKGKHKTDRDDRKEEAGEGGFSEGVFAIDCMATGWKKRRRLTFITGKGRQAGSLPTVFLNQDQVDTIPLPPPLS